jgi:uncharacterized SAM-binding protein YcdF (DUF218 family)
MMESIRTLVDQFASPLTLASVVSVVAAFLWRRRRRLAAALWVGAGLSIYALGLPSVGNALLGPLEQQFPMPPADWPLPKVAYIVVLGSGYAPRDGISAAAALDREGLLRVVEAVRLLHREPGAQLLLSGGAPNGLPAPAHGEAELATELGVDNASVVLLDQPRNTAAEARAVAAILGIQPFLLVTSAWHMPRAMRLMTRVGARAIPVSTGQQTGVHCPTYLSCLLPHATGLARSEIAMHEYLGLLAVRLNLE